MTLTGLIFVEKRMWGETEEAFQENQMLRSQYLVISADLIRSGLELLILSSAQ